MEKQRSFFEENDYKVSMVLSKITSKMTLVFPVMIILNVLKVFKIEMKQLIMLSVFGTICTLLPSVLAKKKNISITVLKYANIIAIGVTIMLLGGNEHIGIYMTHGLAMAFSCMYYDKEFTKKIAIISTVLLTISLYMRAPGAAAIVGDTPMAWFFPQLVGFLIEQAIMSAVFIKLASGSRKILEGLQNTEKVVSVVEKCENVSTQLVGMVDELAKNMEEIKTSNANIVNSAVQTHEDCSKSLEHVNEMQDSINRMADAVCEIGDIGKETIETSDSIAQKMTEYVGVMEQAADSMKDISSTANMTGEAIENLEKGVNEISGFVGEISNITAQTNLLALNASIEAARAGDQGRGFAVVADEVRELAERSRKSSTQIETMIGTLNEELIIVKQYNEKNLESVGTGIEKINAAMEGASALGIMQGESIEKAKNIVEQTDITKNHGEIVKNMAVEMGRLVEQSIQQIDAINEDANNQNLINERTNDTFIGVDRVAKDLLEICKIEI